MLCDGFMRTMSAVMVTEFNLDSCVSMNIVQEFFVFVNVNSSPSSLHTNETYTFGLYRCAILNQ